MTAELDSQSDSVLPASPRHGTGRAAGALGRARFDSGPVAYGKIGRYTVLGQLAGGGMGAVYLALMRGPAAFSRLVAIKCLHTRWLDDPKYVARFTTEVRLTTRIRHPNVVEALDVVEEAGELFLVMEYVDGVTLAALLADLSRLDRPLPVELAAGMLAAVLRGLHAAHETTDEHGARLDIVHRDVSPQNIMISRSGHVQVLDFGAAKAIEHSQHTAAGVLVGKLAYMAPEQVHGERSSPCTDIFAAGIVLWEALVGKRLFYDPSLARGELLQALVRKPIARPSQLRPDVPRALDVVVKKALDRNPKRRYQNALELAEALELFASGPVAGRLSSLVRDVSSARLAEKDELLRVGMAAVEAEPSVSTPAPSTQRAPGGALVVPAGQHTLPGLVLSQVPRPQRGARWVWLAAVVAGAMAFSWWCARLRFSSEPRAAARSLLDGALGAPELPSARERAGRALGATSRDAAESEGVGLAVSPSEGAGVTSWAESAAGAASLAARASRSGAEARRGPGAAASAAARRSEPRSPRFAERCDPPTYMDAAGIRHFKKGCL
jgi:eukaryotic-like serine/threonine-protein kinase